jgi:hypothetical protein
MNRDEPHDPSWYARTGHSLSGICSNRICSVTSSSSNAACVRLPNCADALSHDELFGEPMHGCFSQPARAGQRGQSKTVIGLSQSVQHRKRTVSDSPPYHAQPVEIQGFTDYQY